MANDFHRKLKRNSKAYRSLSSCSQNTHCPNKLTNALQTTTNAHSVSFNDRLHCISVSDSTDTPVCSDHEDSDDDDEPYNHNNVSNGEPKQWYMAFPDDSTSRDGRASGITQSAPNMDDNSVKHNDGAKTLYPIDLRHDLHQLYSEGAGRGLECDKSMVDGGEGMTMMGYTQNESLYLYSEGQITMDVDEEEEHRDNVKQKGITLMGMETMGMGVGMDIDIEDEEDQDSLIHKQGSNVTLMGYCEGNHQAINEANVVITLIGMQQMEAGCSMH